MPDFQVTVKFNVTVDQTDLQATALKRELHEEAPELPEEAVAIHDTDRPMQLLQDQKTSLHMLAWGGVLAGMEEAIPSATVEMKTINVEAG